MLIHILNAHLTYPNWSDGALNAAMVEIAASTLAAAGHEVSVTVIENGYDPELEAALHLASDAVILQTPINWFGAPWIHKKYVDEVFNVGLHATTFLDGDGRTRTDPSRQYGTGGHMHGKRFLVAATWNAPIETFDNPASVLFAGKRVDDLLLHITANYAFVGYSVLEPFGVYDIFRSDSIAEDLERYRDRLIADLT